LRLTHQHRAAFRARQRRIEQRAGEQGRIRLREDYDDSRPLAALRAVHGERIRVVEVIEVSGAVGHAPVAIVYRDPTPGVDGDHLTRLAVEHLEPILVRGLDDAISHSQRQCPMRPLRHAGSAGIEPGLQALVERGDTAGQRGEHLDIGARVQSEPLGQLVHHPARYHLHGVGAAGRDEDTVAGHTPARRWRDQYRRLSRADVRRILNDAALLRLAEDVGELYRRDLA